MSTFLKKSLITIIVGFSVAWISSAASLALGVNYRPIYADNTLQVKAGSLSIGKNSNPTSGTALDVAGITLTNGFLSRGIAGVHIFGDLQVRNLFLINSVTGTSTPTPVCVNNSGIILNC